MEVTLGKWRIFLLNMIKIKVIGVFLSDLALMTRESILLIFKVKGQGHNRVIFV